MIKVLQNVEGLFSLTILRDKSLAVVAILNSRQVAMWRTKVFQYPRARSAQKRNLAQCGDLVLVDIFLIFLGPSLRGSAMQALFCIAAEFAHDHRFVVGRGPGGDVH